MHESARLSTLKAQSRRKDKRPREDNFTPEPTEEQKNQLTCLLELKSHLECHVHSTPGAKTYCWVGTSSEDAKGGHCEMKYEHMMLWAKLMSMKKATKYTLPNVHWLDHLPTKKLKTTHPTPEVHVAINISPTPEAGSSTMHATYIVSDSSSLAVVPVQPVRISNIPPEPKPVTLITSDSSSEASLRPSRMSAKALQASSHGFTKRTLDVSLVCILMDCIREARVPSVLELLLLVDFENLAIRHKQIDVFCGLVHFRVEDIIDIYSLPVYILAALGGLDKDEAKRLHAYCRDKFLGPMLLLETRRRPKEDSSVMEIPPPSHALKQRPTGKHKVSKHIKKEKKNVPPFFELQVAKQKLRDEVEVEE
ncbi:hypothetical protein EI94DRAFT_1707576 [Lactarius quietus]|nr:hypothetical protein EI94DRAFT_1707576 [Lactarius quietus]